MHETAAGSLAHRPVLRPSSPCKQKFSACQRGHGCQRISIDNLMMLSSRAVGIMMLSLLNMCSCTSFKDSKQYAQRSTSTLSTVIARQTTCSLSDTTVQTGVYAAEFQSLSLMLHNLSNPLPSRIPPSWRIPCC